MEQRTRTVALRFTDTELQEIDQQAAAEGRTRSDFIRWAIRQYLTPERDDQ